jgi:hypothetical protein
MKKEILSINLAQALEAGLFEPGALRPPKVHLFDTLTISEDGKVRCGPAVVATMKPKQLAQAKAIAKESGGPADVPAVGPVGPEGNQDSPTDPAADGQGEDEDHGEPPLL